LDESYTLIPKNIEGGKKEMADKRFGIREICDVVLRAKTNMQLGDMYFEKDMPVLYFNSLKTSSLEGAATTVYA